MHLPSAGWQLQLMRPLPALPLRPPRRPSWRCCGCSLATSTQVGLGVADQREPTLSKAQKKRRAGCALAWLRWQFLGRPAPPGHDGHGARRARYAHSQRRRCRCCGLVYASACTILRTKVPLRSPCCRGMHAEFLLQPRPPTAR